MKRYEKGKLLTLLNNSNTEIEIIDSGTTENGVEFVTVKISIFKERQ